MHTTAKNKEQRTENEETITLLEWFKTKTKSVYDIMHRLDYETHGLVLFAKNERSFLFFKEAQMKSEFIKEYSAVCERTNEKNAAGFPPSPLTENFASPFVIESYFRPFGQGRKLVRPVIEDGKKHKETAKDNGNFYRTEVVKKSGNYFTIRIKRGFRHQIRCHLCWIGFPIVNDPLYSCILKEEAVSPERVMALRSHALFFPDPVSGERREYKIDMLI